MIVMLAACSKSNETAVLVRQLPPTPAWAQPVLTPDPKRGEDILIVAARERSAKAQANTRLIEFRSWYGSIRSAYLGRQDETDE